MRRLGVPLLLSLLAATLLSQTVPAYVWPETHLVLIDTLAARPLPADLHILEEYEAFVLAEVSAEELASLQKLYRIDRLPERTVVCLHGTVFDTRQGEPDLPASLQAGSENPYYLVQFYGPVKQEWLDTLEGMGVSFLGYHPHFTYIVHMDPALVSRVRQVHAVQWVGPYHPAYRLASETEMQQALTYEGRLILWLRAFPGEDPARLQRRLEEAGALVEFISPRDPPVARVWAAAEQLPALAALPGVYRIEPYQPPQPFNERAAQVMHTWDVWKASRNGLLQDLMGAGQVAGVVDTGLDNNTTTPSVEDFYDYTGGAITSRVAANLAGNGCGGLLCICRPSDDAEQGGHGTHVAGSIVGNGYNALAQRGLTGQATAADPTFDYAWGVGQAPEARIAFAHVSGRVVLILPSLCGIGDAYLTWLDLYNAGARNVNNSWGSSFSDYGGDSVNADAIMWAYQDYLVVNAAGNAGPGWGTVQRPGTAKNAIVVGATSSHRSIWGQTSETATSLTNFTSRGPVNLAGGDGRFKPDVVAPGADVLSTRSNAIAASSDVLWGNEPGDGDGDGSPDYVWSGGTSMAAPLVTGAATIVRDYFQDIQGLGNSTPPSAALIKAALLNGAVDMGYGYESFATAPYGGRNLQGWGMVNLEQSITPRAPRSFFYDDYTDITEGTHRSSLGFTASGQFRTYSVLVEDPSEPLKVTLAWTDVQSGTDGFAVDNLDLRVTSPDGIQYLGNVFSGSWSTTGGSPDDRNNTEAVYLQSPAVGMWGIEVVATNIAPGFTQPYALVVSGGFGPTPVYMRSDAAGRAGSSGRTWGGTTIEHLPSLRPLTGSPEHVAPGDSFAISFRLTNWGAAADTISLAAGATDMAGAGVSGIAVSFAPGGPFELPSGASVDVQATVRVRATVPSGPYDVTVTATSGGPGNRRDALVVGLNVIPAADLPNEAPAVPDGAAQYASDLWGTGQLLWAVYLSMEDHNNSEAEIWTARSTDGGASWTKMGQVDPNDGGYYLKPAIAGNADGSSVTVVWTRPNSNVYARTWTAAGGWKDPVTLAAYTGDLWRVADADVIYDGDGTILAVWQAIDLGGARNPEGVLYARSLNDGTTWAAAAGVPDASGENVTHNAPHLTLDTSRNEVWMAYSHDVNNRDIRLKRWSGLSNTWQGGNPVVASTVDREIRPAVGYVAATDALWVTWLRYTGFSNPVPRLYYARSAAGTLPTPTFGAAQGPYGRRVAEVLPAMVVGDASAAYVAYLSFEDAYRGGSVYLLNVPPEGGPAAFTDTVSVTVDDPPLYARGNAGSPKLFLLQTTVNGQSWTGPTLLYSKNAPDSEDPHYGSKGVAQTLFDLAENFDLYLSQAGNHPTAVKLVSFEAAVAAGGVLLTWETASELDNLGFHLYRSASLDSLGERLNQALIPSALPGGAAGASYAFLDRTARAGVNYRYTLEDVDSIGHRTRHGPVSLMLWRAYLPLAARR